MADIDAGARRWRTIRNLAGFGWEFHPPFGGLERQCLAGGNSSPHFAIVCENGRSELLLTEEGPRVFASPSYPAVSAEEIDVFVAEQFCGKLIATDAEGFPHVSLLPFVREGDVIEVHMVQADPTCAALRGSGRGAFLLDEPLAFTPHHVVSERVAMFATLHFRAVVFQVEAEVSADPADVAAALERLMVRYEGGAAWEAVADGPLYGPHLRRLAVARLKIVGVEAKFKLAQNRTPAERAQLLDFLRARGLEGDARAVRRIQEANP